MNKNKKMLIIFLIGFIISVIGFTGSFLMYLKPQEDTKDNNTGDTKEVAMGNIIFSSIDDSVYLEDTIPTLDKFGIEGKGFSFTIQNTTNINQEYQLKLVDDNSTIKNKEIRYELIKNNKIIGVFTLPDDGVLDKSIVSPNDTVNYTIKLWLDYNSDVKAGRFSKKIAIDELNDSLSNITKPVLTDGMIPVYYDLSTNSWLKTNQNNIDTKWYNYEDKNWANVVTVVSEKRDYYLSSENGTKIDPNDINSMWVWIPRFNYENDTITFVNKKEPAYSAFSFNNSELDGFWFSKFESGMKEDSECISLSLTKKCNSQDNILYFVPNYPFATKMTMANMFYVIRKMELKNNIYGFKGNGTKVNNDGTIVNDNNNIDIHMIKNSEWEAVVLLSNSKYGKNGNTIINNNGTLTGKAYYENEEYSYNVSGKGEIASTNGNVSGIYDMSGGKREYVMVNTEDLNIFDKKSNSGFSTSVKEYYYDNKISLKDEIKNRPVTRGGYKNDGNITSIDSPKDYLDKVSVETNSRASLVIIEGENNEEEKS